jgi:imidazole glycerol phosphate synthase subunit HisF
MIKRIGAVVILNSGLVVNTYKFSKHLPVGSLKLTIERLQELRIDEIIILNSEHSNSPDLDFKKIYADFDSWHISTPIAFGGGIISTTHASSIIKNGADRVVISTKFLMGGEELTQIGEVLGDQALILHLPIIVRGPELKVFKFEHLSLAAIIDKIPPNWGGEVMISVVDNDGSRIPNWKVFNQLFRLLGESRRIILSSGFSLPQDISKGLKMSHVQAVAIGNYLHRTEVSVPLVKNSIGIEVQIR